MIMTVFPFLCFNHRCYRRARRYGRNVMAVFGAAL
jgi:hypothetical protein